MDYFRATEAFSGLRAEIRSNRWLCIEGADGILDYSDEEILVKSGKLRVKVTGRDLRIAVFSTEGILVEGVIGAINYGYEGR